MPVAVNWIVVCLAILELAGVTARETSAGATVIEIVPETPCIDAVIVVWPLPTAVRVPLALMVAVEVEEELHDTKLVMSRLELSVNFPVALSCSVCPTTMSGFWAVNWICAKTGDADDG